MTNWAIDWKCTLQHEFVLVLCATLFDASVSMVAISANSSCAIYCPLAYCRYSVGLPCNSQNSLTILSNIVVVQSCARFHSLMLERLFIFNNCRNDENSIFGLCLSVCAFTGNNNIVRGQH